MFRPQLATTGRRPSAAGQGRSSIAETRHGARAPLARAVAVFSCALILGALGPMAVRAADLGAESVFRDARQYTVRIRLQIARPFYEDTEGSYSGAGFLVDSDRGWIVTNAHVAGQSPSTVQVAFADGVFRPARKLYVDTFSDIAVLVVQPGTRGRIAARMDCQNDVTAGEGLGVFGHPRGLPFTATRGIVSGHTDQFGPHFIQTDATVDHGNSGGPVIRLSDGAVIGIATAGIGAAKNAGSNFVTPVREVCRILELLREGVTADAMAMPFSLLVDEDGRSTLTVGQTHDPQRWPVRPGDEILGIEGAADTLRNLGDFVTALRGRRGTVRLRVRRGGTPLVVTVKPEPRPSTIARWGVSVDGALIAEMPFEDGAALVSTPGLMVHSIEDGSMASSLDVEKQDLIESVDGRPFNDLPALSKYLAERKGGSPLRLVLRRWSPSDHRIFDYHVRDLPGDEIELVGNPAQSVAAK